MVQNNDNSGFIENKSKRGPSLMPFKLDDIQPGRVSMLESDIEFSDKFDVGQQSQD